MANPEFITIKDKTYKVADLSEKAIGLANNAQLVQNEIAHKQTEISIYQVAAYTIIAELVAETASLEEVVQEEDTAETAVQA